MAAVEPGSPATGSHNRRPGSTLHPRLLVALLLIGPTGIGAAHADDAAQSEDTWRYRPGGPLAIAAGLELGLPAALTTGLATGAGVAVTRGHGLVVGARLGWATATESSLSWTVTHDDLRLRVTGAVERAAGRGAIALRLGVGGTLVHERRERNQGKRAGLTGSALATSAWAMVPAADLDVVLGLHVAGPWSLQLGGGPGLVVVDGAVHARWTTQLALGWHP